MKIFECKKCSSKKVFIKSNGTQNGLYCSECGSWIKWLGKEEYRLAEIYVAELNAVPEEDIIADLSQFSDEELLEEIRKRMKVVLF